MAEETNAEFEQILKEMEAEENQAKSEEGGVKTNNYPHLTILKEENLLLKDLPDDIKSMAYSFNGKKGQYTKQGKPEKIELQLQSLSVIIADRLMDFLEKDIAEPVVAKKEEGGEIDEEEIINEEEIIGNPKEDDEIDDSHISDEEDEFIDEDENHEDDNPADDNDNGDWSGGLLGTIFNW